MTAIQVVLVSSSSLIILASIGSFFEKKIPLHMVLRTAVFALGAAAAFFLYIKAFNSIYCVIGGVLLFVAWWSIGKTLDYRAKHYGRPALEELIKKANHR